MPKRAIYLLILINTFLETFIEPFDFFFQCYCYPHINLTQRVLYCESRLAELDDRTVRNELDLNVVDI